MWIRRTNACGMCPLYIYGVCPFPYASGVYACGVCSCTLMGCVLVRLWGASLWVVFLYAYGVCPLYTPVGHAFGVCPLYALVIVRLSPVLVCLKGHPCTLMAHRQKNKGGRPQGLSGGIE